MGQGEAVAGAEEMIFRRVLVRPPDQEELAALIEYRRRQQQRLEAGELDAAKICGDDAATARRAALVLTARAVMNLDEAISKP